MSEIPERLRDAGTSMEASVQPLRPRTLRLAYSTEGRIGLQLSEDGLLTLPTAPADSEGHTDYVLDTPPGFSRRWTTTIRKGEICGDVDWFETSTVLNDWQRGRVLLDTPALAALGESVAGVPVAHGVWTVPLRTATLPPATHTNAYVVGLGANVVVDPGTDNPGELDRLCAFIEDWSKDNGPIQAVLLTHHHADHMTGARLLSERLNVPVWAHAQTAERIPVSVHRTLEDDERLGEWMTLWTPGHAPGHLCLWHAKRRLLVAGDMVASVGTIVIDPPDGDMSDYLAQLRRLHALEPRVLYPAHGEPLLNPAQRLENYIAHRLWRETQIESALRERPAPLSVVTERAYGDVPSAIHWLAQRQALAHLNRLVALGRAQSDSESGYSSPVGG